MALSFEESKRMVAASPAMTMEASIEDARPVVDCDEDVATFSVKTRISPEVATIRGLIPSRTMIFLRLIPIKKSH